MPVIAREGWIQWLDTHGTRRVYDENPTRVLDLCKDGATVLAKFETLARSKNVVLLTKAAMGNKLQTIFYHSVVGVPIRPEEQHYVAMSGKFGRGVELDITSLFKETKALHVPSLLDMMKVDSQGGFKELTPPNRGYKKKDSYHSTMVPFLTEAIHRTDMSPSEVFMAVVKSIKATAEVPPTAMVIADDGQIDQGEGSGDTGAGQEDATDNILKEIGAPYEKVLRFIWVSHHHSEEVRAPVMASLQDEETVQLET